MTHGLQLSLAALMTEHLMGVYENKQFDVPLKIGGYGSVRLHAAESGAFLSQLMRCGRRLLGRLQGQISFLVGDSAYHHLRTPRRHPLFVAASLF